MKKYDIIIGVDIGISKSAPGGIALFDVDEGELLNVYDMPTEEYVTKSGRHRGKIDFEKLLYILEMPQHQGDTALVVMEDVHAFSGQGSVSTGTLMEEKGILRGMAFALGYDEMLVHPKTWQKHFLLVPPKDLKGKTSKQTRELRKKWLKSNSLVVARGIFPPEWEDKFADPKHHGRSDACLLANYTWVILSRDAGELNPG